MPLLLNRWVRKIEEQHYAFKYEKDEFIKLSIGKRINHNIGSIYNSGKPLHYMVICYVDNLVKVGIDMTKEEDILEVYDDNITSIIIQFCVTEVISETNEPMSVK